jgi:hypothetical protein
MSYIVILMSFTAISSSIGYRSTYEYDYVLINLTQRVKQ